VVITISVGFYMKVYMLKLDLHYHYLFVLWFGLRGSGSHIVCML